MKHDKLRVFGLQYVSSTTSTHVPHTRYGYRGCLSNLHAILSALTFSLCSDTEIIGFSNHTCINVRGAGTVVANEISFPITDKSL